MVLVDRRVYRRAHCRVGVILEHPDLEDPKPSKAVVSDISEGGMRFSTGWRSRTFDEKYAKFKIPGRDVLVVRIRHVWTRRVFSKLRFETGVRFLGLGLEAKWQIRQWVGQQRE